LVPARRCRDDFIWITSWGLATLVNEGRSIYEVQKLLGHANVSTTQRYAHLSQDTLAEGAGAL
jgi:integrase